MCGDDEVRHCLNCGGVVAGNYCPQCGQSADTGRFTARTFVKHIGSTVTRMSGNFFRTAWLLLSEPWNVIRDFVYGRRVGLMSPVSMLILLAFYYSVLSVFVPVYREAFAQTVVTNEKGIADSLMKFLYGSLVLEYLVLAIPVAVSVRWVYRKQIRGRFNFVELVIAALYLSSTYLILCVFTTPLDIIDPMIDNLLVSVVMTVYAVTAINRAFPQKSLWKRLARLGLCLAVSALLTTLFLLLAIIPGIIRASSVG